MEEEKTRNSDSISTIFFSKLSSLCTDPLFSSIITLYALILLYIPTLFLRIIFSPVFNSTGILFFALFRLGAVQKASGIQEAYSGEPRRQQQVLGSDKWVLSETNPEQESEPGCDRGSGSRNGDYADHSFLEWDVRAPLEIIYEDYEGELVEEEEDDGNGGLLEEKHENGVVVGVERYPSLSRYYPESDTDSSSDGDFPVIGSWDSPERMVFKWDEEEREELIEIALDGKRSIGAFHFEDDNLIEIDISPSRNDELSGKKW